MNQKVAAYSSETAKRQNMASKNQDPLSLLASLSDEKSAMVQTISDREVELAACKKKIANLEASLLEASNEKMEANQKLVTLEVAGKNDDKTERALNVLSQLQDMWREMGITAEADEDVIQSIENCLEDTCERKLVEVKGAREAIIASIEDVVQKVEKMQSSLGVQSETPTDFASLLAKKQHYEGIQLALIPKFLEAVKQASQIAEAASNIKSVLGFADVDLPVNLQRLIIQASNASSTGDLTPDFLSRCEEELSRLRIQKSEVLVQNNLRQNEVTDILKEMNISDSEAQNFILQATEKRNGGLPNWWNTEDAQQVCQTMIGEPSIPKATKGYSDHLTIIHETVKTNADVRRALSEGLYELVERAHQTLLSTVKGGHDAAEACASFQEALLRLPKLSKEYIGTCLSRIADLILGVDDMIQSEIEALTVVWEALGTDSEDREQFWELVVEGQAATDSSIFGGILTESTGWLYSTAKQGQEAYTSLDKKLFKLQTVHEQVETLGARQDAKSKVLSLDSEVRLLNAQLAEFEEKKCSKDRLLSRQTASSQLLREERYRKQMKAKFTSKLEQLAELLKIWNEKNSKDFDPSILSDDVRMLLQNTSWIWERNELMHLRTTKSKRLGKRKIERTGSSESESISPPESRLNALAQPKVVNIPSSAARRPKRSAPRVDPTPKAVRKPATPTKESSNAAQIKRKASSMKSLPKAQVKKRRTVVNVPAKDSKAPPASTRQKTTTIGISEKILPLEQAANQMELSDKENKRNKRMTLPPFGHVLEESITPRNKSAAHETSFGEN